MKKGAHFTTAALVRKTSANFEKPESAGAFLALRKLHLR
jgi:hypothetical protein